MIWLRNLTPCRTTARGLECYFRIQRGRGEVRSRRFYLNVHSVTGNVGDTNDLLSFGDGNTAGNLETTLKAARGFVGYGGKIFLLSPSNYVTRSRGCYILRN